MFFGYNTEADMRRANPELADLLIARSSRTPMRVASRNKPMCTASFDGKTFHYVDGTRDDGEDVIICRAGHGSNIFSWSEEKPQ
jgi:hypothetical protein